MKSRKAEIQNRNLCGQCLGINTRGILCADPKTRNAGTVAGWDTISLCALLNLEKVLTENRNLISLSPILVMERSQLLEVLHKALVSLGVLGKMTSGCKQPVLYSQKATILCQFSLYKSTSGLCK
ncbi:MAG: hypothetical protein GY696_09400 [Gammaproteobacteria bacterium]|nr:hypothetical protein [Gammaproteobacteria bacterium]